jgi:hypothetical protein
MSFKLDLKPLPGSALAPFGKTIVRPDPFCCGWCGATYWSAEHLIVHVLMCREES